MSRVDSTSQTEMTALGVFLRGLAARAERDPAFAGQLLTLVRESGLLAIADAPRSRKARLASARAEGTANSPPDPFALLRERGEAGLRSALGTLDLAALRGIVRAHRLDPARISARWTARDRLMELIVDQVRARANHGRAFERV
ncbi:MAG: hypothetical protein IVW57_10340 [Ktedonobacterales bacterium]|nr:hypothetical protein [Ktedonobacterales bacterium]